MIIVTTEPSARERTLQLMTPSTRGVSIGRVELARETARWVREQLDLLEAARERAERESRDSFVR